MTAVPGTTRDGNVHVIELEPRYERVDWAATERLQTALSDAIQQANPAPLVVADMGATEYFTSDLIGWLIQARREVIDRGGRFAVCSPKPFSEDLLRVVKFDELCHIYGSRDEAVKAIGRME